MKGCQRFLVFFALSLLACVILGSHARALNYISNGNFQTNVVNWTEVEVTGAANGATSWSNTGAANGGSIQAITSSGRSLAYSAYNNQTIRTNISAGSSVYLSFSWLGTYASRVPSQFNLSIVIVKPDSSAERVWGFQGTPTWNAWNAENITISNIFDANGTYQISLYYNFVTASTGQGGSATGRFDEVILDVTPPDASKPTITLISPSATVLSKNVSFIYNVSDDSLIDNCSLYINGILNFTNTTVNKAVTQNITIDSIPDGQFNWSIGCYDAGALHNYNMSANNSFIHEAYGPMVDLQQPLNNTLQTYVPVIFYYNVSDFSPIANCSLIINGVVQNTSSAVTRSVWQNFTFSPSAGQNNWSVNCTDSYNHTSFSQVHNITIKMAPIIVSMLVDDYLTPQNEIILQAGSTRKVSCYITCTDSLGPTNINNASSTFSFFANTSSPDDPTVHYSNSSCSINQTTSSNRTFRCDFDVVYYAVNGTWACNATVQSNTALFVNGQAQTLVNPLYALNITQGMFFGDLEPLVQSQEHSANITNIGNMPLNISVAGYARTIGDGYSMNCTDSSELPISDLVFALASGSFASKMPLAALEKDLGITMDKQVDSNAVVNRTYWQMMPSANPTSSERFCEGNIIFFAKAP